MCETMANTPKRRGSVLLMVVGLLTMIAMLGGTFLVIAYLDAKSTTAMVAKVQADPLAKGLATQTIAMLAEKLDIADDTKGPYSSNSAIKPKFAAHPKPDQLAPYLYFYDPDASPVIRHPSVFDGGGGAADEVNIDNDPGGIKDGYLHESKTMNANGDKYFYAVQVTDLGGLLCVNTAGNKTDILDPVVSVVNVNLADALSAAHPQGDTYYNKVHGPRCGTGGTSMQNLHDNIATRLTNPQGGAKPFAVGDELYLRLLKTPAITETGRLYEALKSFSARRFLTTISCTRSLVRHPDGVAGYLKRLRLSGTCLDAQALRDYLRNQLMMARKGGTGGGGGGGNPTAGDEIIIDDADGSPGYTLNGSNWLLSTTSLVYQGTHRYIKVATPGATARWTFTVPKAGSECEIFVIFYRNYKRDKNVTYRIYDGEADANPSTTTLSQYSLTGGLSEWVSLGKHLIEQDNGDGTATCIVEVDGGSAGSMKQIVADACKLVPYPPVSAEPAKGGPEPAHFLANLWASLKTPTDAAGMPFKVTYLDDSSTSKAVYGLVNQPFIVETYAQHKTDGKEADAYMNEYRYGFAMRLMNPSKTHAISLENYKIKGCPGGDINLSGMGSIPVAMGPTRNSKILYDVNGGGAWAKDLTEFGFGGADWQEVPGLRFWKGSTIRIVRVVDTDEIPVDSIRVGADGDLKYDADENDLKTPPDTQLGEVVKKGARRDDSLTRGRYSVAIHHHTSDEDHKLNESTGVDLTVMPAATVKPGFHVEIPHRGDWAKSPADLAKLYQVGPTASGGDLPHILANLTDAEKKSRGRANFLGDAPPGPDAYPDVPWATLVGEIFEFAPTDTTRSDDPLHTRVYGRVNINTAPVKVLRYLPWPSSVKVTDAVDNSATTFLANVDVNAIVNEIVAYREKKSRSGYAGVNELRTGTAYEGYMTPGELAIPLAKYFDDNVAANLKDHKLYMEARDQLYRAVSTVISVNSDVFAVNILVQLGNPAKYKWYYIAIVDRSNCRKKEDRPTVLLFSQVH